MKAEKGVLRRKWNKFKAKNPKSLFNGLYVGISATAFIMMAVGATPVSAVSIALFTLAGGVGVWNQTEDILRSRKKREYLASNGESFEMPEPFVRVLKSIDNDTHKYKENMKRPQANTALLEKKLNKLSRKRADLMTSARKL